MEFLKKNLANIVTLLRVFMTPLFVVFMVLSNTSTGFKYAALGVFAFGAVTDWFDGQIARRMNIVSQFGITGAAQFREQLVRGHRVPTQLHQFTSPRA